MLKIIRFHILVGGTIPKPNRATILESNALIKVMSNKRSETKANKTLYTRHGLLVKETTVTETTPYSTYSAQKKWDRKTTTPLCLPDKLQKTIKAQITAFKT